jgi:hypothetical protein
MYSNDHSPHILHVANPTDRTKRAWRRLPRIVGTVQCCDVLLKQRSTVKSHFQLKRAQAHVEVSARYCELFDDAGASRFFHALLETAVGRHRSGLSASSAFLAPT